MSICTNRDVLLSHGYLAGRATALDILETGLAAGDPLPNVVDCLRLSNGQLIVGNKRFHHGYLASLRGDASPRPWPDEPLVFDLDRIENIYVIGAGKAAQRMAEGIERVLGDHITDGQVNAKKGETLRLERIGVTLAGHPMPDEDSVTGSRRMVEILQRATERDLIFQVASGGATALQTCPPPGVTLQQVLDVNRILYFEHGAPMPQANAVRGLLSVVQRKAFRYFGNTPSITFSTSEQPIPPLQGARTLAPEGMDDFEYAIAILHEYECWDEIPDSVRQFLLRADPAHQMPKPEEWWHRPVFNFRIAGPELMLDAALARAKTLGLNAQVLVSSMASLDARTIGEMAGYLARETIDHGRPLKAPCAWIFGGELVVPVGQEHGLGGRNQEFVLASALHIDGYHQAVIASADSDGRDGPSKYAGAIVDGSTMTRAAELGIDVMDVLHRHDTTPAFDALGDGIETGVLPTNVQDLRVILVAAAAGEETR